MSAIDLTITPTVATTQVVIDTNTIQVTPEAISLNVFTQGAPVAGGTQGQIQYNNLNTLAGASNTSVSNGNVSFQNLPNLKIAGGSNAYFLQTDGTGNLTWAPGTVNANSGNGIPVGANTQIQITDGTGNFVSAPGFTFDNASNLFTAPGNAVISANLTSGNANLGNAATANYFIGNGAFLTGIDSTAISNGSAAVRTFLNANVAISAGGTTNVVVITSNTTNVNGTISANFFSGDGYQITNVSTAGTVTNAAQPNITSVGDLTNLNVLGTTSIYEAIENVALIGAQTGTYNFNLLDGSIQYSTANATANLILNFRGNSTTTANSILSNGKSITSTYLMTNGNTGYTISSIQIDGNAQTIKWVNGSTPSIVANIITAYTFTIVKTNTAPTYTVFASATRY